MRCVVFMKENPFHREDDCVFFLLFPPRKAAALAKVTAERSETDNTRNDDAHGPREFAHEAQEHIIKHNSITALCLAANTVTRSFFIGGLLANDGRIATGTQIGLGPLARHISQA